MRRAHRAAGLATAGIAAVGLIGSGAGAAMGVAHPSTHKYAATPTLKITVKNTGTEKKPAFSYSVNHKKLRAGLVDVAVHGVGTPADVSILSFAKGYNLKGYIGDFGTFESSQDPDSGQYSKAGLKALHHLVKNTTFYGGPVAEKPGATQTDTLDFNKAAKVYILNDSAEDGPPDLIGKVKVTGRAVNRKPVKSGGTITARTDSHDQSRFSGDKKLPHHGTISFSVNSSSTTPHFLNLLHVKAGTTKKQVEQYLSSASGPPPFELPGEVDTDVVSPGHTEDISADLPKGEYVALCFFPDLKTGMPHAFMGMIGIYHLA
jgi:hypothetical protein